MSVMLIACCYWQRANNWGAIGAIIFGAVLPITCLIGEQWDTTAAWFLKYKHILGILTYISVALAMVVGSLLKPMDKSSEGASA